MRRTMPRRGGFTLVELLAVVSILALLAALGVAAFLRVRGSEEVRASEATLSKLKSGLDKRWTAVLNDAADDSSRGRIPAAVMTFADNDKDRAKAIWTYCKLKNEFPTTLNEACQPVLGTALPAKAVFLEGFGKAIQPQPANKVRFLSISTGNTQTAQTATESAACFQWALTATAVRGETFDVDGTAQQTGDLPVDLAVTYSYLDTGGATQTGSGKISSVRTFKDAYGNPILFVRQAYLPGETDKHPYTKVAAGKPQDPLDPLGKLVTPGSNWTAAGGQLATFWATLYPTTSQHLNYVGFPSSYPGALPTSGTAPGSSQSWVPTLISAGASKKFWFEEGANFGADDDLFSFRLAREGNRGN